MPKPKTPPPPPKKRSAPAPPKAPPKSAAPVSTRPKKKFTTDKWDTDGRGKKIVLYARYGMGKTTLAALAPKPLFVALDEGGLDIKHPITGEPLDFISGVESYEDVLDVMDQSDIMDGFETMVVDHVTELEERSVPFVLRTIPNDKGNFVKNITAYGYNKGFDHMHDAMRAVLVRADRLVAKNKNVIFLAQSHPIKSTHPEAEDFLMEAPHLHNRGQASNVALINSWAGEVYRIGYTDINVEDKKATGGSQRAVYVHPEAWYYAKSRVIPVENKVISFESPQDSSIWQFLFGGE